MIVIALISTALAAPAYVPPVDDVRPARVELTDDEVVRLSAGETVYRYDHRDGADVGMAATIVDAPATLIWKHVLDYGAYHRLMPYVIASSVNGTQQVGDVTVVDCQLTLLVRGLTTEYSVRNWHYTGDDFIAFEMASGVLNPLRSASGWWQVHDWRGPGGTHLLVYRIELSTAWFVPDFVKERASQGLPKVAQRIDAAATRAWRRIRARAGGETAQ